MRLAEDVEDLLEFITANLELLEALNQTNKNVFKLCEMLSKTLSVRLLAMGKNLDSMSSLDYSKN